MLDLKTSYNLGIICQKALYNRENMTKMVFNHFFKHVTKAFTLAEVLITLLIIGVIASIVIPGLIANTNKAEFVTKLKKEQAILSQAFNMVKTDAGGSILNSSFSNTTDNSTEDVAALNDLAKYLNLAKNCGIAYGCWYSSPLKWLSGTTWSNNADTLWGTNYGKGILSDGTIMVINIYGQSCANDAGTAGSPLTNSVCGDIKIDINGTNGPNTFGRDVFVFFITKTGIYPRGIFGDVQDCVSTGNGQGCAGKVLLEGAMNY